MLFHQSHTFCHLPNTFQSYSQNKTLWTCNLCQDSQTSTAVLARSFFHCWFSTLNLSRRLSALSMWFTGTYYTHGYRTIDYWYILNTKDLPAPCPLTDLWMAPQEFCPVEYWVALEEATAGVDEVEGCEAPTNDEGVLVAVNRSWEQNCRQNF